MSDKSTKPEFNNASGFTKPRKQPNYSHHQLLEKLDNYASAAKTGKDRTEIVNIRKEYLDSIDKKAVNRATRNVNYQMGIRAGLHPHLTVERLMAGDREVDQRDRNQKLEKAKDYYHRNYSLAKTFKETKEPQRDRNRTIDRGE